MKILQRISAITIMFILIAGSMLFLVEAPGKGNASGAAIIPDIPLIQQPQGDSVFNLTGRVEIKWTEVANVDYYRVEWTKDMNQKDGNGNYTLRTSQAARVDGTSFSYEINDAEFHEGWFYFHVRGVGDQNGNNIPEDWTEWSDDIHLCVDAAPPSISLGYPEYDNIIEADVFQLSGTASDSIGVKEIWYDMDQSTDWKIATFFDDKPTELNWTSNDIGLDPGDRTVEVKAVDWAGRQSDIIYVEFSMDMDPPELNIDGPGHESVINNENPVNFHGTTKDDNGIVELVYSLNGEEQIQLNIPNAGSADGENDWSVERDLLDGPNTFWIMVKDRAEKIDEETITVYYDSDDPIVDITDYQDPGWDDGWHMEKRNFGNDVDWYIIDDSGFEGDLVGSVDDSCGVYELVWTKYRENGDHLEDSVDEPEGFRIDNGDPLPNFNPKVDWRARLDFQNEDGDGIYEIVVRAEDRTHTVNIQGGDDDEGKFAEDRVMFVYDTQDPQIQTPQSAEERIVVIQEDPLTFALQENPFRFNLQVNDNIGIMQAQYKIDDGGWQEFYNHDMSQGPPPKDHSQEMNVEIPDGQHGMELMIFDIAGHQTSTSFTVILDTKEPSMQINEPSNNDVIEGDSIHIGLHVSDNVDLAHIEIFVENRGSEDGDDPDGSDVHGEKVDEEDIQGNDMEWGKDIGLNNGKNIIYVRLTDIVGRQVIHFITVYIDNDYPSVTISGLSEGQSFNTLSIPIQGNADDDSGLIERVEIRFLRTWEEGNTDTEQGWTTVNGQKDWTYQWDAEIGGDWVIQTRSVDMIGRPSEPISVHVTLPGETPDEGNMYNDGDEGGDDDGPIIGAVVALIVIIMLFVIFISTSKGVSKAEKELSRLEDLLEKKKGNKEES